MAKLQIGNITIIVNGFTLNNGLPYFQRAVPKRLQKRLGKKTIKIRLHIEDGNYALQCHRLTLRHAALFKAMVADPRITPTEAKLASIALLGFYGLSQLDGRHEIQPPIGWEGSFDPTPHLNEFLDAELPLGHPPSQIALMARDALFDPMPILLSEAFSVYLDNHKKASDKNFSKAQKAHWDRLINFTGDIALEGFTRDQAKKYRDERLSSGVKAASVEREISTIKAIFEKAIVELSLQMKNPFAKLLIQGADEGGKRPSFTKNELRQLIDSARVHDDERRRLALCMALTGARLAEIVGLRKQDVDLEKMIICIVPHASRSLKTKQSKRRVPMHPWAAEALKVQMIESTNGFIFPAYANEESVKSDSVSAMLKKWIVSVLPETQKTAHSMRHTMADLLREVETPLDIKDAIGGWSNKKSVAEHYGEGYSDQILQKYLMAALKWLDE